VRTQGAKERGIIPVPSAKGQTTVVGLEGGGKEKPGGGGGLRGGETPGTKGWGKYPKGGPAAEKPTTTSGGVYRKMIRRIRKESLEATKWTGKGGTREKIPHAQIAENQSNILGLGNYPTPSGKPQLRITSPIKKAKQ